MKRKKLKKITRKQKSNLFLKFLFLIVFIFFLWIFLLSQAKISTKSAPKPLSDKQIFTKIASKSAAIITPYPTSAPKPTQTVLSGFCLRVPVLMYHHIQPESQAQRLGQKALTVDNQIFASQMEYLFKNGYTPIWANELANALASHTQLNGKAVVITMDDGYEDNFIYAFPILRQYNFKANLMLATGLMGNADMLSWSEVKALKDSGLFYFTNHTWSHYAINRGPQETINSEIDTGANQIQSYTGQLVNMFTYPYGAYNDRAIATLKQKGYIGAFSEIPGQYQCDSFLMTLHRIRIGNAPLSSYGL